MLSFILPSVIIKSVVSITAIYSASRAVKQIQKLETTEKSVVTENEGNDNLPTVIEKLELNSDKKRTLKATKNHVCPSKGELYLNFAALGSATLGTITKTPLLILCTLPVTAYRTGMALQNGFSAARDRRFDMAMMDSLFLVTSLATGNLLAATIVSAAITTSRTLLYKTEDNARKNFANAFHVPERIVTAVTDTTTVEIFLHEVQVGTVLCFSAGEIIPVDGKIRSGKALIDQQVLTGEAMPVSCRAGDSVLAATLILEGNIVVIVEKLGANTVAAQIGQMLDGTIEYRTQIESSAMHIAHGSAKYSLAMYGMSLPVAGFEGAAAIANANFGIHLRALGPLCMLTYLKLATEHGIMIKDGRSLDILNRVDTIVFDKTGTLTQEYPSVRTLVSYGKWSSEELLQLAASVEMEQSHPIAKALRTAAINKGLTVLNSEILSSIPGQGICATVTDAKAHTSTFWLGNRAYMQANAVELETEAALKHTADSLQTRFAQTIIYIAKDLKLIGHIGLEHSLKPEAAAIIAELKSRGIEPQIISGDCEAATAQVAHQLGIEDYYFEVLPQDKAQIVKDLQTAGKTVCFIGDGINDAVALKQAQVSISFNMATEMAKNTADMVLVDGNLEHITRIFDLANAYHASMRINTIASIAPGTLTIFGVMFAGFGLLPGVLLNAAGFTCGTLNTLLSAQAARQAMIGNQKHESPSIPQPNYSTPSINLAYATP